MLVRKTPWFQRDVRPIHVGEYETRNYEGLHIQRSLWDGEQWMYPDWSYLKGHRCFWQNKEWRGLTKKAGHE